MMRESAGRVESYKESIWQSLTFPSRELYLREKNNKKREQQEERKEKKDEKNTE